MIKQRTSRPTLLTLTLVWAACSTSHGGEIDEQRALFMDVYPRAELGDWSPIEQLPDSDRAKLTQYVLWADLRAAYLRATIKTAEPAEVEQFLNQYGTLKPARELRYRFALQFVKDNDLARYLQIYQQYYQGLEINKLDCLALQAEIAAGHGQRIANRARELWEVGKSQAKECDPVFTYLQDNQLFTPVDYANRYALAIKAREFSLARWLAKSIDEQHVAEAAAWSQARSNPEQFVRSYNKPTTTPVMREQLAYAIERITYADPELALELWSPLKRRYGFSTKLVYLTDRHVALWTARDGLAGAYQLLTQLPAAAQNSEVMRWRARTSIRNEDWSNLQSDIAAMSASEKKTEEWTYWRAVALQRSRNVEAATELFEQLALERSYYGFLAADELDRDYVFDSIETTVDEAKVNTLANRPDLIRARELFLVGLDSRGRSEWDAVIDYFNAEEKQHAAVLADRWGWHSRAIATAGTIGQFDDLELRYPLPYEGLFQQFASDASIPSTWAYGIARSESLFMRDVKSSAGAIGLMQLMPATGKAVAREINLPYSGISTLTIASSNIQLGTTYLSQMAAQFGGNRVLATAAYNAGPHRVGQWLPEHGTIDARFWIENIPFNETRKYVRRVLAAETIFHWRMTGKTRRLSDELMRVQAQTEQLASR